jgi:predicted metal-dependent hydrolase
MKIKDGDVLQVFGRDVKIVGILSRQSPKAIAAPSQSEGEFMEIGGAPEFLDRRVRDRIKKQFLLKSRQIMREMPPELRPRRVTVRDTSSRWGSCSATGTISLSWRLSFAPPEIMRYVIIHECCHLREMNHSRSFWTLVAAHFPDYKSARAWLRKNGQTLFEV